MGNYNLEVIVRPYIPVVQQRALFNAAQRAPIDPSDDEEIVWGKAGDSVFQLQAKAQAAFTSEEERTETSRTFDIVRVKDPNNSDNHIDVEVMTQYQSRNKIDQKRVTLNFTPTESSENVEILSRDNTRTST